MRIFNCIGTEETLITNIKKHIENQSLKLDFLAEKCNITSSRLTSILSSKSSSITVKEIAAFSVALDASVTELLTPPIS